MLARTGADSKNAVGPEPNVNTAGTAASTIPPPVTTGPYGTKSTDVVINPATLPGYHNIEYNQVSDAPAPTHADAATIARNNPPPSYESLFGRVKVANTESKNRFECTRSITEVLCGTLGCTVIIALFLALPIAMLIIGAIYVYDCPHEYRIPIYLIVGGVFGIIKNMFILTQKVKNDKEKKKNKNKTFSTKDKKNTKQNPIDAILNIFLGIWFICGCIWVYTAYGQWSDNPTSTKYCHLTVYYFAFWSITTGFIILGTIILILFLACLILGCLKKK